MKEVGGGTEEGEVAWGQPMGGRWGEETGKGRVHSLNFFRFAFNPSLTKFCLIRPRLFQSWGFRHHPQSN